MSSTARKPIFPVAVTAAHSKVAVLQVLAFCFHLLRMRVALFGSHIVLQCLDSKPDYIIRKLSAHQRNAFHEWRFASRLIVNTFQTLVVILCLSFPLCQSFQLLVCICDLLHVVDLCWHSLLGILCGCGISWLLLGVDLLHC